MRYSYSWHWSTETANHACHRPGPAPICCIRPVSIGSGHDGDGDSRALVLINQSALHGRRFRKSGFRDADRTVRPSRSFRSQIRWGSNASKLRMLLIHGARTALAGLAKKDTPLRGIAPLADAQQSRSSPVVAWPGTSSCAVNGNTDSRFILRNRGLIDHRTTSRDFAASAVAEHWALPPGPTGLDSMNPDVGQNR
jgi:hypothetical protein